MSQKVSADENYNATTNKSHFLTSFTNYSSSIAHTQPQHHFLKTEPPLPSPAPLTCPPQQISLIVIRVEPLGEPVTPHQTVYQLKQLGGAQVRVHALVLPLLGVI